MILVDGIYYNVNITECNLSTNFVYKFAERTEDMKLNYELGGVFFNESITIGFGKSAADFRTLWNVLSSRSTIDNGTGHNVQIWTPMGKMTFTMYPENFTVKMLQDDGGNGMWTAMVLNFIGTEPARS